MGARRVDATKERISSGTKNALEEIPVLMIEAMLLWSDTMI